MQKLLLILKRCLFSFLFFFKKKKENLMIVSSYNNESYNFISRIFFEFIVIYKKEVDVYFIIDDDAKRAMLINKFGPYFLSYRKASDLKIIYSAKFWLFSTKSFCMFPTSLKGRKFINLWHGVPLKSIGIEDKFQSALKRLIYKYYYSIFNQYLAVQAPCLSDVYSKSFNVSRKNHLITGVLVSEMFGCSLDEATNLFVNEKVNGKFNILYAPTYRDGGSTKYFPFSDFKLDKLVSLLKNNDAKLFIRPHHLDKGFKDYIDGENIVLLSANEVEEISFYLNRFELLITDYSSIMFDYAITGGTVITFPYDKESYTTSRGLNYNYDEVSVGKEVLAFEEFIDALNSLFSGNLSNNKIKESFLGKDLLDVSHRKSCSELYNQIISL
ncbi:MAG: hypothetical protein CMK64_10830 [Pseudoalteromonas sp.]|nr:hypothetical protein [Pseudoalteromonas sp.]